MLLKLFGTVLQIAFVDHLAVVDLVAGQDVGHGADGELAAVGHSAPFPGGVVKASKDSQAAATGTSEGLEQHRQRLVASPRSPGPEILIEAGQLRRVGASKAQAAIGKSPLGVDQMAHDLAQTPLAHRITEAFCIFTE